jgi:uncharacterized repeat protein (TIGR01451 family)
MTVNKTSRVVNGPAQGSTDATEMSRTHMRYCILVTNIGSSDAFLVSVADRVPANLDYMPGTIQSGAGCAETVSEDDDQQGSDENDPVGANFADNIVNARVATLPSGASLAIVFDATTQ